MASILKVDTIQDQSGNNIINENANTITIGASGDTITIPSGATLTNNGTQTGLTLSDNILFNTASKGIYLGTTTAVAANLLDDYEEGTWTPTLGSESTDTGQTYVSQVGKYTKIGDTVYISGYVRLSVLGTLGGAYAAIKGLPFTSASSSLATGTVSFSYALNFASNVQTLGAYIAQSDTLLYICGSSTTGTSPLANLLKTVLGGSTELAFAGFYKV